jgi:hypothetical protein
MMNKKMREATIAKHEQAKALASIELRRAMRNPPNRALVSIREAAIKELNRLIENLQPKFA